MQIASAKLTGTPSSTSWAQVHDFTPVDKEKLSSRGRLIIVLSASRPETAGPGIQDVSIAREIIAGIHREYFDEPAKNPLAALERALEKVFGDFSKQFTDLEIGAASMIETTAYTAVAGRGRVILLRKGSLATILTGEKNRVLGASGRVQNGDTLLFGTSLFFSALSWGVIKAALGAASVDACVENLAPSVRSQELGALGMVVIRFSSIAPVLPVASVTSFGQEISPQKQVPIQAGQIEEGKKGLKMRIAGILDSTLALLPDRRIKIKSATHELSEEKSKKTAVLVGVILLFLLVVSIFFGINRRRDEAVKARYEPRLAEAIHNFQESQTLSSLDSSRARALLLEAKRTALELKEEGVEDPELVNLIDNINQSIGTIAGIYETTPELFVDLSLLTDGFEGDDLDLSEGRMLVLDSGDRKMISSVVDTKKSKVEAGPDQLPEVKKVAAYADRNFVLADDGIWEVTQKSEKLVEKDWGGAADIYLYASNVYVLDKDNSAIWRYAAGSTGFGARQNWFGPGVSPDLSASVAWTIDGSIWILRADGKITKFTLGKPDSFVVEGLETPINQAVDIYTNETAQFLYILDPQNSRVVVVDKKGQFKAEYLTGELASARKIVASEADKELIFLTGSKLLSINLGHLQ